MSKTTVTPDGRNKKKKIRSAARWRSRAISIAVAAFFILTIFLFFANSIGLAAKVLNGAKVAGESIKVTEFNFYNYSTYNMYVSYGILTSQDDLDNVGNSETGETYREIFAKSAAESWQQILLLERQAKADGFTSVMTADALEESIAGIRKNADGYGITADRLLEGTYGPGITVRTVKKVMEREAFTREYLNYLVQTKFAVSPEEVQRLYDENPGEYSNITFNAYRIPAIEEKPAADESDTDGTSETAAESTAAPAPTEADVQAAADRAQKIIDAAEDPESFRDACEVAGVVSDEDVFADGANPTLNTDFSKSTITSYYGEDVAEYLCSSDRKEGDKTVIKTEKEAYAIYYQSRGIEEDATVSYRKITLTVDAESREMTADAQIVSFQQKLEELRSQVDGEDSFSVLAKQNSADSTTAIAGGLVTGSTRESFTLSDISNVIADVDPDTENAEDSGESENADADTESSEETDAESQEELDKLIEEADLKPTHDDILYEWLFAAERKAGDMMILENTSTSSVSLYFYRDNRPNWQAGMMSSVSSKNYQDWFDALKEEEGNGYRINYNILKFAS